jgi:NADH-quinone oxidoreductase subunit L
VVWVYYQNLYAKDPTATEVTDGWRSKSRVAAGGYQLLANKYYLDHLYQGGIVDPIKGAVARGAYWINQNIIDEVVNTAGRANAALGRFVYRYIDQGVIDGSVNISGRGASESGGLLRKVQTGRIRNYASLMFGAAAVLAAVFILAI